MLTQPIAQKFVTEWIEAFNAHDVERILSHYADHLEFYSPFIALLKFDDQGVIRSKPELKRYFEVALTTYPDLKFSLHNFFVGMNTVVIYYTSVNGRFAAETFELNDGGLAVKVYCNYTTASSRYA